MQVHVADFEAMYRAAESRDRRFDGRVFIGVTSTRIYCRPICAVPMPKRHHVRFFGSAVAAEQAGFRACRRCRPEASPDAPDWDIRADLVGRGLRLIAEGVVDREGVDGLARELAVGTRRLRREFLAELGAGPLSLARSRRAALAKQLLEHTDLPSTDVAFASGFASVRAYHATIRRLYGLSPTEIRERRAEDPRRGRLGLRLAYRPPLAWRQLSAFLGERAIPGVEELDGSTYRRSVRTLDGDGVVLELTPRQDEYVVHLEIRGAGERVPRLAGLVQTARRLLDLDADPEAIDATLSSDATLAPLVAAAPGTRLPGAADGFELAVRAIVGQQVSVAAARTTLGKITQRLGTPVRNTESDLVRCFPTPAAFAVASNADLGLPAVRAESIRALSRAVAGGELDLTGGSDVEAARAGLAAIRGIGPWTVAYVAMRALRDPDAFPTGDLGLRRTLRALGLPNDVRSIAQRSERWRPWRGYASMLLWQAGDVTR